MVDAVDTDRDGREEPEVPPPPPEVPRLLVRPLEDRMIFGVAAGLGRYLGVDPVLVRVAFVLLAVLGGSGVLLYLVGFVVIPEERPGEADASRPGATTRPAPAVLIGGALVIVGTMTLMSQLLPSLRGLVGPAVLVGLGVVLLTGGRR